MKKIIVAAALIFSFQTISEASWKTSVSEETVIDGTEILYTENGDATANNWLELNTIKDWLATIFAPSAVSTVRTTVGGGSTTAPSAEAAIGDALANKQDADADLTDLADGSLTGSKVGTGINGDNITSGTVADTRIASTIARDSEIPTAAGPLTVVATGFNGNLTTTDDTVQEVAQKVDDLVVSGGSLTDLDDLPGDTVDDNLVDFALLAGTQASDADLTTIAALTCTENQIVKRNSSNAWICGSDNEGAGGGISHATSDGNYYASRNGAWASLTGLYLATGGTAANSSLLENHAASYFQTALTNPLIAAGTQALTADWDVGAYQIRALTFYSDVATGTAPFTVASTTAVANLNASLLEGHAASYFQTALTNPLVQGDVDDTPVNGVTTAPVSSNWAYDHVAAADPHTGYVLESAIGTTVLAPNGSAANLTSFPTLNQNTTGTAAGLSGTPNITVGTLTAAAVESSAADGAHYITTPNTVTLTSTATLGRLAWLTDRWWLANGTNWTTRYLLDSSFIGSAVQAYDAQLDIWSGVTPGTGVGTALAIAPNATGGFITAQTGPVAIVGNAGGSSQITIPNGTANLSAGTMAVVDGALGNASATSLSFGADPADSGAIRLSNNTAIFWEAATPGTDIPIAVDGSNIIQMGQNAAGINFNSAPITGFDLGASDTTIARSGAGAVTVEGVQVVLAGGSIGTGTATTPSANDNDTSVATTAYVQTEIAATASDTETLTNKTLDTAGTGNAITVPYELPVTLVSPADADDPLIDKVKRAVTLTGYDCVAIGGGTISVDIQECDANGANCETTGATTAACGATNTNDATLTDTAIASGAWLKMVVGVPSGTVSQVSIKLYGTQTW